MVKSICAFFSIGYEVECKPELEKWQISKHTYWREGMMGDFQCGICSDEGNRFPNSEINLEGAIKHVTDSHHGKIEVFDAPVIHFRYPVFKKN